MSDPVQAMGGPVVDGQVPGESGTTPRNSKGWDGKLRVDRKAVVQYPDDKSDDEESDEESVPKQTIEADEDLLDDYPLDTDEIDLVHCRISSIPALRLERFTKAERLCLRQNAVHEIQGLAALAPSLQELDLYDNLIRHIHGLEELVKLTSLDLSFNNIKTIKRINHLHGLKDLYFVQNKIQKIEGLDGLTKLRNLELAANRIREIEKLENLKALEELWLGKNNITEIKNVSTLINLKIISIQSNRLTKISGLDRLVNLEELYISHNALTAISGLEHNVALRVLDISANQIANLSGLTHLTRLEELWASNNQLASYEEIEQQLVDKKSLNTVYFEGNPLQTKTAVMYRNKIRLALPQVQQIDATFVRVS